MKTKSLGWTGLELTRVGLGTWAIGGGDWAFAWGPQDDRESITAIRRGLELGINWIDTAPAYGLGHGEEVVGRALKGLREKPLIATKCGRSFKQDRTLYPSLKREVVRAEVEASLRRLQVDVIDLYQIHWPQPAEEIEEGWGAISDLVEEGKVRFAGVSNFSLEQLKRVQPIHPVASLQPPYSMLVRGVEDELLPYCAQHNIGVIGYSPMQKGLLTGKMTAERIRKLPADDHRQRDPLFQEPALSRNLALVGELKGIAKRLGATVPQVAIAWVLRRPEVTAAIVGSRSAAQIEETIGAAELTLLREDLSLIEALLVK